MLRMKKWICLIAAILLLFAFVPGSIYAEESEVPSVIGGVAQAGYVGDPVTWEYEIETQTMTLSCDGEIRDFGNTFSLSFENEIEQQYGLKVLPKHIVIKKATSICSGLLVNPEWIETVESIELPEGLVTIGYRALECIPLKELTVPSTVTSIGNYAFEESSIESIELPEGLVQIGEGAFLHTALKSVKLPSTLETIGAEAFRHTDLTEIDLPENLKVIGAGAFASTGLKSITLPSSLCGLGVAAFADTPLEEVLYPDGLPNLKVMDRGTAFGGTPYEAATAAAGDWGILGSVLYAYYGTETSVRVPDGVRYIYGAFVRNETLERIDFGEAVFISNSCNELPNLKEVRFGPSFKQLGAVCFRSCPSLREVVMPETLEYFCWESRGNFTLYSKPMIEDKDQLTRVRFLGPPPADVFPPELEQAPEWDIGAKIEEQALEWDVGAKKSGDAVPVNRLQGVIDWNSAYAEEWEAFFRGDARYYVTEFPISEEFVGSHGLVHPVYIYGEPFYCDTSVVPQGKGDVNGDGKVDAADAALILRAAVGLIELNARQRDAAAFTDAFRITAQDAAVILRQITQGTQP